MDTKVKGAFWTDEQLAELPQEEKLTVLWAMTNPRVNCLGMSPANRRQFEFETGCPRQALERACHALPEFMSIHGDTLWVHNYTRHQFGSGRKLQDSTCFRAVCSALESVRDDALQRAYLAHYPEVASVWPDWRSTPMKNRGHAIPIHGVRERERERESGGSGGGEIPSEAEWMEAAKMAGLPEDYARAQWHQLGEAGFQVRQGIHLTRANLRHAVARRVEWWRERNKTAPNGRLDREALRVELENLRSEGDDATLPRRREIAALLEGGR